MKYKSNLLALGMIIVTLSVTFFIGNGLEVSAQPGASDDPLVTKSYVDAKINEVLKNGGAVTNTSAPTTTQKPTQATTAPVNHDAIVSDVVAQIEFLYGDKLKASPTPTQTSTATPAPTSTETAASNVTYVPVNAKKGQIIIGEEGTEIILRSGTGTGYCEGQNGLVNATTAGEILNGSKVSVNNLLIVPRSDGRGIKVTSDEAWFIIKGDYYIK